MPDVGFRLGTPLIQKAASTLDSSNNIDNVIEHLNEIPSISSALMDDEIFKDLFEKAVQRAQTIKNS